LHRKRRYRKHRLAKGSQVAKASLLDIFSLIGTRPEIAGARIKAGHFEGDLVQGDALLW
jgi:IS30 family transposase